MFGALTLSGGHRLISLLFRLLESVSCECCGAGAGAAVGGAQHRLLWALQVFSQIRNEHFSSVFGFLSQKSRNLQAQYDVSVTWCVGPHVPSLCSCVTSHVLCLRSGAVAWTSNR